MDASAARDTTRPPDRITCEEAFRRLDAFLDRELAPFELQRVEEHLETCVSCAREFTFEADVLHQVRQRVRRVAAPPALIDRIGQMLAVERRPAPRTE